MKPEKHATWSWWRSPGILGSDHLLLNKISCFDRSCFFAEYLMFFDSQLMAGRAVLLSQMIPFVPNSCLQVSTLVQARSKKLLLEIYALLDKPQLVGSSILQSSSTHMFPISFSSSELSRQQYMQVLVHQRPRKPWDLSNEVNPFSLCLDRRGCKLVIFRFKLRGHEHDFLDNGAMFTYVDLLIHILIRFPCFHFQMFRAFVILQITWWASRAPKARSSEKVRYATGITTVPIVGTRCSADSARSTRRCAGGRLWDRQRTEPSTTERNSIREKFVWSVLCFNLPWNRARCRLSFKPAPKLISRVRILSFKIIFAWRPNISSASLWICLSSKSNRVWCFLEVQPAFH